MVVSYFNEEQEEIEEEVNLNLWLGNLPYSIGEEEVEQKINNVLKKNDIGSTIKNVDILQEEHGNRLRSRGFGYCECTNLTPEVLDLLNKIELHQRPLKARENRNHA